MAGRIYLVVRIWVYWALAKKMSRNLIKLQVFLGFEPFLLSNSEAEWIVVVPTPQVQVQLIGTIYVDVRIWVYWALAKRNERKPIKNARFSWFWAFFVIKKWSRVEGSGSITSVVCSNGWYHWRGCQNLSLLTKMHVFLGFESVLLSSGEAE